jgi:hypothetical protein
MLRVIGAGFGRTGTASLRAALEQLGFGPCYQTVDAVEHPERVEEWRAAAEGRADWSRIFMGFQSTVDWPGAVFWRELVDAYPEARVILTVVDPESWYETARGTIFRAVRAPSAAGRLMGRIAVQSSPTLRRLDEIMRPLVWDGVFDGRFADREHAIRVFERHVREVRRRVPPDRLLVYRVSQGWPPLCEFLGVPVPAGCPFPWVDDAASLRRQQREHALRALSVPVGITVAVVAAGVAGALAIRRRRPPNGRRPLDGRRPR